MVVPRLIALVAILYLLFFFYMYYRLERLRIHTLEWIDRRDKPQFTLKRAGSLVRADILPMLLITVIYAVTTFVKLGNTVSPQSFHRFERGDEPLVIELKEPAKIERIFYFTGLHNGDKKKAYRLEFSADGVRWTEQYAEVSEFNKSLGEYETIRTSGMTQDYSETFRWLNAKLHYEQQEDTRFIRISAMYVPLELGEVSIVTQGGKTLTAGDLIILDTASELFDEQEVIPERYDVMNSSHFDEIYHARTAYEHLRGIYPYEKTHPPLGKLITASGIALFGMTPFGWRFMPALFGVLMLPLIYILLKWMFGKTSVAVCGTLLFAFDFMHFVQTRISTIDVYAVFFILAMYLCMYRYVTSGMDAPFRNGALWLILAGLSFGVGVAAKWVCAYAGAGLFLLYIIYLYLRASHYRELERSFLPFLTQTLLISLLAFLVIPGIIYIACYIPYATSRDPSALDGSLVENVLTWLKAVWKEFFDNQKYMYNYHSKLVAEHAYAARWYEWIFDWKPILYYWNPIKDAGTRGSIWAFTNPLTTWAGLGALVACGVGVVKRKSHVALFIIIGYLSQLLPWVPISRITFPYHYFPSMAFICLAVAYMFHRMIERDKKRGTRQMIIFTAAAVVLFAMFYPALSGMQVPEDYPTYLLRWLSHSNWLM